MRIMGYISKFRGYELIRIKIIEEMSECLDKINVDGKRGPSDDDCASEIVSSENSIKFKFLDFNISIEFDICASKDIGLIKWFYVKPEWEEKPRRILILKHSFNIYGVINVSGESTINYDSENRYPYYFESLSLFCQKVDEIEYHETVVKIDGTSEVKSGF